MDECIDLITEDVQHSYDCAMSLQEKNPTVAAYLNGVADGMRRALVYLELLEASKKAAMPASTAADPLRKETNNLQ